MRIFVLLASCHGARTVEVAIPEPGPPPGSVQAAVLSVLDPAADPCDDFYRYACGTSTVDRWSAIEENNAQVLREILEEPPPVDDAGRQQLATFWTACMDQATIDLRGLSPLDETLAELAALDDRRRFLASVGTLQAAGYQLLFDVGVDADPKNPGLAVLQLRQPGARLPGGSHDRGPTRPPPEDPARLLTLAGWPEADAAQIVAFEARLAEVQVAPEVAWEKLDRRGLDRLAPGLDWSAFFAALGRPELTQINLVTPPYFVAMSKLVHATDLATLRGWLAWQVLRQAAPDLGRPVSEPGPDRWRTCVDRTGEALGDLLGQAYVARAFPGPAEDLAGDLVARIEATFEARLADLGWMDEDTRARAAEKARGLTHKVGSPERWRTYPFEVLPDDHFGNVRRAATHERRLWLDQAEKPIDPAFWQVAAQTPSPLYDPSQNELVLPAGILQPPLLAVAWPRAASFGGIGAAMGHELIHGFDGQGRRYDAEGRLTDWWAPAALQRFDEAAACLDEELPRDETLADIGGARIAHQAYRAWVAERGEEAPVAGLSGDQLFFVSLAQAWCSPQRVNAVAANLPELGEAFRCEVGEPMRPAEVCAVW